MAAMTTTTSPGTAPEDPRAAFADTLFETCLGAFEALTVYLGDRLGLYSALAARADATPSGLAKTAGIDERYAREWLEQQAAAGIVEVPDPAAPAGERRYRLPPAHAEVLTDTTSLYHVGPLARMLGGMSGTLDALVEAFRAGGGVPYAAYGAEFREAQAALNRPVFAELLGGSWLPSIPDLDALLRAEPPVRVADLACGGGWSSIGIARAYPHAHVDGIDLDGPSIELARANVAGTEVAGRVRFSAADAAGWGEAGAYDVVAIFEAVHDMPRPVEVLAAARRLCAPAGAVLVMDERTEEAFVAPAGPIERFLYAASVLHCLPVGMSEQPSAATGTVMRPDTLAAYAREAGFAAVEILPIEHDLFRLYRLR